MAFLSYEIPLSPKAQSFFISLGGKTYWLTWRFNSCMQCWVLDIADDSKAPLVQGIPVVTGLDLLMQYHYLGIPGSLIVQTDNHPDVVPTFENLGEGGRVYFVAPA